MKKLLIGAAALMLVAGTAFAKGGQDNKLVGLAMPETHVQRWVNDGKYLLEESTAAGYSAEVAFADGDQAKQNQQISDFLTKGAKVLIVGNINEGVNTVIEEAAASKVPVIAYDRLIVDSDSYDYYITFDNFKVGQFQGAAIEEALGLKTATTPKNITLFAGSPTDNNANVFFDGAMSVLKPYIDKGVLKVYGPAPMSSKDAAFTKITTEGWKAELAKTRMENLLNNDCKDIVLDAVLAPNDPLARAIIEACSADKKYTSKLPIVTGQDGETPSIQSIKDGNQYMTVFKDTRKLASAAVLLADAILQGKTPSIPGTRLDTESYDTGKKKVKAYLLEPVMVTKDNYQAVMIDSGYIPAADIK